MQVGMGKGKTCHTLLNLINSMAGMAMTIKWFSYFLDSCLCSFGT